MKHRVYSTRVCTKKVVLDIYAFVHLVCRIRLFFFLNTLKEVDVGFCALNTTEGVSPLTVSAVFKPLSFQFGMNSSIEKVDLPMNQRKTTTTILFAINTINVTDEFPRKEKLHTVSMAYLGRLIVSGCVC